MTQSELAANVLASSFHLLTMHLKDFSDQDMLTRPVPNANHVTWQIGHLIVSETNMVKGVSPEAGITLPTGFAEKFKKDTAKIDDPASFPAKDEILELYGKVRNATVAWAKSLSDTALEAQTNERMRAMAPTVAEMLGLIPVHTAMHIGQIQVLRRKLGKPLVM